MLCGVPPFRAKSRNALQAQILRCAQAAREPHMPACLPACLLLRGHAASVHACERRHGSLRVCVFQ